MKIVIFKLLALVIGIKISQIFAIGAVQSIAVCLLLGHLLDVIASQKANEIRHKLLQKKANDAFLKKYIIGDFFKILAKLCTVDGEINQKEIDRANFIAKDVFKLNNYQIKKAIRNVSKKANFSIEKKATAFYKANHLNQNFLNTCYKIACDLANADGRVSIEEKQLLDQLARIWRIDINQSQDNSQYNSQQNSQQSYKQSSDSLNQRTEVNEPYKILGCNKNDSDQEIKKKYRQLVCKYHPDKILAKDLPEEFITFANQKFQSIQEAYEEVMSMRA